jgi:hypothetical protein
MRLYRLFHLWRPERQRNVVRAPNPNSKLIKLEREIGRSADHIGNHRQTVVKKRSAIIRFFKIIKKQFAYSGNETLAMAASGPKANPIPARPAPRAYQPKIATHVKRTSKGEAGARASASFLVSVCFGLLVICGVIIALLFLQIKDMKIEMVGLNQRLATAAAHLSKVEKIAEQQIANEPKISDASPRRIPIILSNDDIKVIRSFIKVLPPKSGAQQKIHVGDAILDTGSAPVPKSLVDQMPKLRGAKFLIDQNSAIVIIGEGSNRADAVIEPQ